MNLTIVLYTILEAIEEFILAEFIFNVIFLETVLDSVSSIGFWETGDLYLGAKLYSDPRVGFLGYLKD
jgi:hypothetical protein